MEWRYVKSLRNIDNIKNIENKYNIQIPDYLKNIIIKYNGGRPSKVLFNTEKQNEKVMKSLLSYNIEDKENVYIFNEIFEKNYIPFAITEFGDVICINTKSNVVELYLHELDIFEYICKGIEKFFNMLYENR